MSITNHPCDRRSCPECVGGQCFGGGCSCNPALRDAERDAELDEEEVNEDWMGEEG